MKKLCTILLALLLLTSLAVSVSAQGTVIDWDKVDWESFDWKLLHNGNSENSLYAWIRDDASFHDLNTFWWHYHVAQQEWGSEGFNHGIYQRFATEPEAFLIALAKENSEIQAFMVDNLGRYIGVFVDPKEAVPILEGIRLSKEQNPKAVELMVALIERVEDRFAQDGRDITITVPKTGDKVFPALSALLLSGIGFVLLKKKKTNT